MSEQKRIALVTGASSGIGATFARKLAGRGYRTILVARRRERLESLAAELDGEALAADLTDAAQLASVEARIAGEERLELLVNNAGFGVPKLFWEAEVEAQERMHRLHVMAAMRLTHGALRAMVPRGRGAVINVSSVAGFGGGPGVSYGSTKAWMNAFTASLSLELRAAGSAVKMQALCPGFTHSEFHDVIGMDRSRIPRSLWCSPEFVVEASLRGLERGKLFVIPGWRYRAMVGLLRFVPRRIFAAGAVRYARKTRTA